MRKLSAAQLKVVLSLSAEEPRRIYGARINTVEALVSRGFIQEKSAASGPSSFLLTKRGLEAVLDFSFA